MLEPRPTTHMTNILAIFQSTVCRIEPDITDMQPLVYLVFCNLFSSVCTRTFFNIQIMCIFPPRYWTNCADKKTFEK